MAGLGQMGPRYMSALVDAPSQQDVAPDPPIPLDLRMVSPGLAGPDPVSGIGMPEDIHRRPEEVPLAPRIRQLIRKPPKVGRERAHKRPARR
jgi:hypothetical protein